MKKKLVLMLVMALTSVSVLAGCGSNNDDNDKKDRKDRIEEDDEDYEDDEEDEDEDEVDADFEDDSEFDDDDWDVDFEIDEEYAEDEAGNDYTNDGYEVTLEDILSTPEMIAALEEEMASVKESYADFYTDIYMTASGNDIEYVYIYVDGFVVDADSVIASFDALGDEVIDQTRDQLEKSLGIRPEAITYTYLNADGSVSCTYTFE